MSILNFVVSIVFTLFCTALLLRAWMFALRIPTFNPLAQSIFQLSNWLVSPISAVLKPYNKIDTATLIAAWIVCIVQVLLVSFSVAAATLDYVQFLIVTSGMLLIKNALSLVFWVTVLYAIMSWLNPSSPAMLVMKLLLEPILAPIRKLPLISSLQAIDLSPLVLIIVVQVCSMFISQHMHPALLGM